MIIATTLMMMLAAPATDPVGAGRKTFSSCLSAQIKVGLDKKLTLPDFRAHIATTCATQEAGFRAAILAADKADGMKEAASKADADDQVAEYVDKITSEYQDYLTPA